MPTVSIVVTCYKSVAFLSDAVESVLQQNMTDWELILVDDGSPDATWDLMRKLREKDGRIRAYTIPNGGTSRARNYGYAQTNPSSPYVFFLDHDDALEPDALRKLVAYLEAHPEVGLVGCQYQDIALDGRRLGTGWRSRWAPGAFLPRQLKASEVETPFVTFFCATGQGPFALHRRSVYARTEGWEPRLWPHEDTDIFCQVALLAEVHFLPERLYLKRVHPAQCTANHDKTQQHYEIFRDKWDNRPARSAREAAVLRHAKAYYYSMHRPVRDLKYAAMNLSLFLGRPNRNNLHQCGVRIASALTGWTVHLLPLMLYSLASAVNAAAGILTNAAFALFPSQRKRLDAPPVAVAPESRALGAD